METKFKDVAHLYLGCEVRYVTAHGRKVKATLTGFNVIEGIETTYKRKILGCKGDYISFIDGKERGHQCYVENVKPILRPLSDMNEGEMETCIELGELVYRGESVEGFVTGWTAYDPKVTAYLLKQGFDLFNLIESGQAIDKTTLA